MEMKIIITLMIFAQVFNLNNDTEIKNNEIGIPIGLNEARRPQAKAKKIKLYFFSILKKNIIAKLNKLKKLIP